MAWPSASRALEIRELRDTVATDDSHTAITMYIRVNARGLRAGLQD